MMRSLIVMPDNTPPEIAERALRRAQTEFPAFQPAMLRGTYRCSTREKLQGLTGDLEQLGLADAVLFGPGWERDGRCRLLREVALYAEIPQAIFIVT